jgi:flagellar hook-associated protein 3 FlgL
MRITMKELTRQMQSVITDRYSDLAKLQEQLSTGKRLSTASDNPVDTANDVKLRSTLALESQYKTNIDDGLSFMNVTDTAMQSMNTLMQRLRELAVQGSSETVSGSDREAIQKESDQLFRQLVTLINTNYKGDYVFGGTQSKIAPFPEQHSAASAPADYTTLKMAYFNGTGGLNAATQIRNAFDNSAITNIMPGSIKLSIGNTTYVEGRDYTVDYVNGTITPLNAALTIDVSDGGAFNGPNYQPGAVSLTFDYISRGKDVFGNTVSNGGSVLRDIENGVTMPVNIPGDEVITNSQAGVDMIGSIIRLQQNLIYNNTGGINTAIGEIDKTYQAILSAQSKNGARINRLETTLTRNEAQSATTTELSSKLEDVDMAEAATNFSLMQTVYNAALKSSAMTMQHSLVDYL